MRKQYAWMVGVALVAGIAVLAYRGPGREIVRGHVGDVAATLLVFALIGLVVRTRLVIRALATFAIAAAIELGQTLWHATSFAGELTVGSTFDPWDFVAYAAGIAIAIGWERWHHARDANRRALSAGRV